MLESLLRETDWLDALRRTDEPGSAVRDGQRRGQNPRAAVRRGDTRRGRVRLGRLCARAQLPWDARADEARGGGTVRQLHRPARFRTGGRAGRGPPRPSRPATGCSRPTCRCTARDGWTRRTSGKTPPASCMCTKGWPTTTPNASFTSCSATTSTATRARCWLWKAAATRRRPILPTAARTSTSARTTAQHCATIKR